MFGRKSAGDKLRDNLRYSGERSIIVQLGDKAYFGTMRYNGSNFAKVVVSEGSFSVPYNLLARQIEHYGKYMI